MRDIERRLDKLEAAAEAGGKRYVLRGDEVWNPTLHARQYVRMPAHCTSMEDWERRYRPSPA
jgi:hypothetical protein